MKLIYVIVEKDNMGNVTDSLNSKGYQVTIISTTGGFLKKGNATLMICTEDEKMQEVVDLVKTACGERRTIDIEVPYATGAMGMTAAPVWMGGIKQKVEVGGAIIMAVDVSYYNKI